MTMTTVHPREMATLTAEFFMRAGEDPQLSERMAFANTTVHIHFEDGGVTDVCTVWLDRTPITAEHGAIGAPEVELFGPADAWMDMITGKEQLAMAIARGDVTYRGPVRKFLRVVPILRTFDFEMWRLQDDASANGSAPPAAGPTAL